MPVDVEAEVGPRALVTDQDMTANRAMLRVTTEGGLRSGGTEVNLKEGSGLVEALMPGAWNPNWAAES